METAPLPQRIRVATGISPSYASMIVAGKRVPPRPLAIKIFRETQWRHPTIEGLSEDDMVVLEKIDPWKPRNASAA